MCSSGSIGRERADQVLLRIPIDFNHGVADSHDANASGEVPGALRAVVETCHEYGRESVRRLVCTVRTLPALSDLIPLSTLCHTDCGTEFSAAQGVWPRCILRNLRGKLDLAWSDRRRGSN
jgi:hypothetical protein